MTQKNSTNLVAENVGQTIPQESKDYPGASAPHHQDIMADSYAKALMDELFSDIEEVLQGRLKEPTEPPTPVHQEKVIAIQRLPLAQVSLPPMVLAPQDWSSMRQQISALATQAVTPAYPPQSPPPAPPAVSPSWVDRLLLLLGSASLITALSLWLISVGGIQGLLKPAVAPTPMTEQPSQAELDAEFVSYMQRSLQLIDEKHSATATAAQPNSTTGNGGLGTVPTSVLPPVPISGTPSYSTNPAISPVLNRIYVPIYPSPQSGAVSLPAAVPLPSSTAVAPPPSPTVSLPKPPAPIAPSALPKVTPTAPATAAPQFTLVGILDLGDRSAALFEINGMARRITLGEAIGSSGWSLVEVGKQEAIVRRNGEVRSIYVGQKF